MLKFLLLVGYCSLLFSSSATDICKKNFDDEIKKQTTMKQNLIELDNFCISKQNEIKSAYKKVSDYEQKILNITKHNLIKSTLKLGYEVFQEITPLNGIEGNVAEIGSWIKSKMEDYVESKAKEALGITPKDYYDVNLKILSNDLSKLTPEVKKLNMMRTATLEAFKIKVQRETNQTVGDVGALYSKLKSLAEQSEKAKSSLYIFYRNLDTIINSSKNNLSQINNIIDAYKAAKDRTCIEYKQVPEPDPKVSMPEIKYSETNVSGESKECSLSEISEIEDKIDALQDESNKISNELKIKFNKDLLEFNNKIDEKNDKFSTSNTPKEDSMVFEVFGSVSQCYLPGNIEEAYKKTEEYYTDLVNYDKAYINFLEDETKNYDDFYNNTKDKYSSDFAKLKDIDISMKKLSLVCKQTYTLSAYNQSVNDMLDYIYSNIRTKKRLFLIDLETVKLNEKSDEKILKDDVDRWMQEAKQCVQRDKNDLDIMLPKVTEFMNDIDERDMAIDNLLDYFHNLKEKGMLTTDYKTDMWLLRATFNVNKNENNFFSKLYNNFSGDNIDYMEKLQEILRPIDIDISNLKLYIDEKKVLIISLMDTLSLEVGDVLYRNSRPFQNTTDAEKLKTLFDKAYKKAEEDIEINGDILEFTQNIIHGKIPNIYYYPYPFKKVSYGIADKWYMFRMDLKVPLTNWVNYKEILNGARNFRYRIENTLDIKSLNYLNGMQESIDNNITYLKNITSENLPSSKAKAYDLTQSDLGCKDSLITLITNRNSLTIFGKTSASLDVNISSCDNRNITLETDLNQSMDDVKIIQNNNRISLQLLNDYNGDLNLILKAYDKYGNKTLKELPIHLISSFKSISLKKGWNLISGGFDASNLNNDIIVAWSYIDGRWYASSPNKDMQNLLSGLDMFQNIAKLDFVPQKLGVWVYTRESAELKLDDSVINSIIVNNTGWSLIGNTITINSPNEVICKDSILDFLWEYLTDSHQWKVYYKGYMNEVKSIMPNSGFWVHCSKKYR